MELREAFLVEGVRTPVGRLGGALAAVRPDDLLALVLRTLVDRTGINATALDEVIAGCANQAGEDNRNVARMAVLLAGLPQTVPASTTNRLCASGLDAVAQAARAIKVGEAHLVIAGGVESMTRGPWVMAKPESLPPRGVPELVDSSFGWRFVNPRLPVRPLSMGETAENLAEKYDIGREEQDAFALRSHRRAVTAWEAGHFDAEAVAVEVPGRKGATTTVTRDEGPRADATAEALARLRPVFREGGTVTAGNASALNDGAAAVLLASAEAVARHDLTPVARVVTGAVVGIDPSIMGIGPVEATHLALRRAGWALDDLDTVELNEAFAAQSLAVLRELPGLDEGERVNPQGGAIAIGHPLGSSGARLTATLLHRLRREPGLRRGLVTLCIGVGQGQAVLVESVT